MKKKMKRQGVNPYLPSWEYIPDGEPYVFGNRVYVYGSHDRFNGYAYCLNDYVCWSASVDDLTEWKYEGVIYERRDDPANQDGDMCLYAPDVTVGSDGKYYLYYVLDKKPIVSIAVCDTPAGKFKFYGYVQYSDGTLLGERKGDQPQFDPGVFTEYGKTYLYTGFCMPDDKTRSGAMVTVIGEDMRTVEQEPRFIVPSAQCEHETSYKGHAFFEASSIRKVKNTYYFIYSSVLSHELCYATSTSPVKDFTYRGTIVSNNDLYIDSYKPAEKTMAYGGNNHGSIVEIKGKWYVFYHRHTNGTNFSRQGCIEEIKIQSDGTISQVEITSCGSNGGSLEGSGEYPAYIACNLFCRHEAATTGVPGDWMDCRFPKITQDGKDGEEVVGYIANMRDGACAGFKYFKCSGIKKITIRVRGACKGCFLIKTAWNGESLGYIDVKGSNEWVKYSQDISIPDGKQALYFEYRGQGYASLAAFVLE